MTSTRRILLEALGLTLLVGLAVALLAWPFPVDPAGTWVGGSQNDHASIALSWELVAERVTSGQLPWGHTDRIEAPEGATLFPADLPGALMLVPLMLALGPIVVVNLAQIAHHGLAAGATWLWLRREGAEVPGALAGALVFALAPALVTATFNGNPDVSVAFYLPLTLALLASEGRGAALGAGLVVALAGASNPYVGVMSLFGALAALLARQRARELPYLLVPAALGAVGITVLTTMALHAPDAAILKGPRSGTFGTASLAGLLWPRALVQRTDPDWALPRVAVGAYLGLSALGLALLARDRRRLGWWMVAMGVLMALGPTLRLFDVVPPPPGGPPPTGWNGHLHVPLPWAVMERFPGIGQLHLTARFTLLAAAGLAWLAARGTPRLGRWAWAAPALVLLDLGLLAGAPAMLGSAPVWEDGTCEALADLEPGAVVDLPPTYHELWIQQGLCHRRPVAEGINRPLPRALQHRMEQAGPGKDLQVLAEAGYRWLVHHRSLPSRHFEGFTDGVEPACVAMRTDAITVVDLACVRP